MHQPYSIRPALWIFLFYRFLQVLLNDPIGFCFFSLHKAVKSAVPPGVTELSVSCAARARMEGSATTSLGSAPALLDGRYGTCSFRGWNGELIADAYPVCLWYIYSISCHEDPTVLKLGPPLLCLHSTYAPAFGSYLQRVKQTN